MPPKAAGGGVSCSVKVLARIRPFSALEQSAAPTNVPLKSPLIVEGNEITAPSAQSTTSAALRVAPEAVPRRRFAFDMCFSGVDGMLQRPTQEDVFAHVGPPLVDCAKSGFNACLLAYGQTGSGKTHTIMGGVASSTAKGGSSAISAAVDDEGQAVEGGGMLPTQEEAPPSPSPSSSSAAATVPTADERGVIPRLMHDIFSMIHAETVIGGHGGGDDIDSGNSTTCVFRVVVRYFEVYCEKVYDLLVKGAPEIRLKCKPSGEISGATEVSVVSAAEGMDLLSRGNKRRAVGATLKNERSSRSHAIFQLEVHRDVLRNGSVDSVVSIVSLVDLAGSERQKQSGAEGKQLQEMIHINTSLSTLRRVIQALHDNANKGTGGPPAAVPPIRESTLTSVLAPCFGGNAKTVLLLAVSPSLQDLSDSMSTLEFGKLARKVVNHVFVNEDANQVVIRQLSAEIDRLKEALAARRQSCRMSMRALQESMRAQWEEQLELERAAKLQEQETSRRTVGTCTVLCGTMAAFLPLGAPNPLINPASDAWSGEGGGASGESLLLNDDEGGDDDDEQMMEGVLLQTARSYAAMQDTMRRHVLQNATLAQQVQDRDITIAALRRQVQDALCVAARVGEKAVGASDVVSQLAARQEGLYIESERLRTAHLQSITQLADLRNQLNTQEDQQLVIDAQASRIAALEAQVAHHMEERVALLMHNFELSASSLPSSARGPSSSGGGGIFLYRAAREEMPPAAAPPTELDDGVSRRRCSSAACASGI